MLISSCNLNSSTCTLVPLTKEELSWFKGYKNGETRLYKSQFGDIDTLRLRKMPKVRTTGCNRLERGEFEYELIEVNFDQLGGNYTEKKDRAFTIHFTKDQQELNDQICEKYIRFQDIGTGVFLDIKKIDKIADTLLLNNTVIYPYHFSKKTNLDSNGSLTKYTAFDVHKKYGLTRYETKKGEVYKYWKKI